MGLEPMAYVRDLGKMLFNWMADCVYHLGYTRTLMKKKPADSTLDAAWRKAVLQSYHYRCGMCGLSWESGGLECHHIIRRRKKLTRWDWRNGIPLCADCHPKAHTKQGELFISNRHPYYQDLFNLELINFKDYLQAMVLTENEWRARVLEELKGKVRDDDL